MSRNDRIAPEIDARWDELMLTQNHTRRNTNPCTDSIDSSGALDFPTWYALHVKSRHEFTVWHELRRKRMDAFLPTVKRISHWTDRKKLVEQPLFPGYVFVALLRTPGLFLDVLKTRGVAAFISLEPGVPTEVPHEEIDSLRLLVESGREIDVLPALKNGARVRIKRGALSNAEGILVRKEYEYIFHVNVNILGRSVAIKVTPDDLDVL